MTRKSGHIWRIRGHSSRRPLETLEKQAFGCKRADVHDPGGGQKKHWADKFWADVSVPSKGALTLRTLKCQARKRNPNPNFFCPDIFRWGGGTGGLKGVGAKNQSWFSAVPFSSLDLTFFLYCWLFLWLFCGAFVPTPLDPETFNPCSNPPWWIIALNLSVPSPQGRQFTQCQVFGV